MKINGYKTYFGITIIALQQILVESGIVDKDSAILVWMGLAGLIAIVFGLVHKGEKGIEAIKQLSAVFMYLNRTFANPAEPPKYLTTDELTRAMNGTQPYNVDIPDILKPNNALGENQPEPIESRPLPTPPPPKASDNNGLGN